jgi:hypothetical protein
MRLHRTLYIILVVVLTELVLAGAAAPVLLPTGLLVPPVPLIMVALLASMGLFMSIVLILMARTRWEERAELLRSAGRYLGRIMALLLGLFLGLGYGTWLIGFAAAAAGYFAFGWLGAWVSSLIHSWLGTSGWLLPHGELHATPRAIHFRK